MPKPVSSSTRNRIYRRPSLLMQLPTEATLSKLVIVDLGCADTVSRRCARWSKKWPFVQTHGCMRRLLPMASLSEARIEVLTDPEALARRVADWLLAAAAGKDGPFAVALSGGSTPRRLYELLASPPCREAFPWSRTH